MMTATLFQPTHRGPRNAGFYSDVLASHASFLAPQNKSLNDFIRRYFKRATENRASAAGPYTPELAVKLFRATAALFAKTEVVLQAMRLNSSKPLPSASGSSGASAKADAAPAPSAAGGKVGRAAAAAKSAFRVLSVVLTMAAGPAGFSKSLDDEDYYENHHWAMCSQIEPEKLKAHYNNG